MGKYKIYCVPEMFGKKQNYFANLAYSSDDLKEFLKNCVHGLVEAKAAEYPDVSISAMVTAMKGANEYVVGVYAYSPGRGKLYEILEQGMTGNKALGPIGFEKELARRVSIKDTKQNFKARMDKAFRLNKIASKQYRKQYAEQEIASKKPGYDAKQFREAQQKKYGAWWAKLNKEMYA